MKLCRILWDNDGAFGVGQKYPPSMIRNFDLPILLGQIVKSHHRGFCSVHTPNSLPRWLPEDSSFPVTAGTHNQLGYQLGLFSPWMGRRLSMLVAFQCSKCRNRCRRAASVGCLNSTRPLWFASRASVNVRKAGLQRLKTWAQAVRALRNLRYWGWAKRLTVGVHRVENERNKISPRRCFLPISYIPFNTCGQKIPPYSNNRYERSDHDHVIWFSA